MGVLASEQSKCVGQDVDYGFEALHCARRGAWNVQYEALADRPGQPPRQASARSGTVHRLGQCGRMPLDDLSARLGSEITRGEPGPSAGYDEAGEALSHSQ